MQDITFTGEVVYASTVNGHTYFDVRDEESVLSCVAWKMFGVVVKKGMSTFHVRKVDFYEKKGRCQAVVDACLTQEEGSTDVTKKRESLLASLKEEGVLDRRRKTVPFPIRHLVLITGRGSAAFCDMIKSVEERWPGMRVSVVDSLVQGEGAPASIRKGFEEAKSLRPDVILCGRGGGSKVDLSTFDEEVVVRAFLSCDCPVVSAVGHESDESITDLVADVRAKTPTAAIHALFPVTLEEARSTLCNTHHSLHSAVTAAFERIRSKLDQRRRQLAFVSKSSLKYHTETVVVKRFLLQKAVRSTFEKRREGLVRRRERLKRAVQDRFSSEARKVRTLSHSLQRLDPGPLMREKGFVSLKRDRDGVVVKSASECEEGDEVRVQFWDGVKTVRFL